MTKTAFKMRVEAWASKLDVNVQSVTVRSMKTKWASCSTSGRLNFDQELLDLPFDLQDYVVVHELLHFHVPNHGRLWKSLMGMHINRYQDKDKELQVIARKKNFEKSL